MYAVILCGGAGTRLWPLSHEKLPKHFLRLYSDHSLLQETYLRVRAVVPRERVFFITNKAGRSKVLEQIHAIEADFDQSGIIIEPMSLNTAPAAAYALKYLLSQVKADLNETVLFLPADHYIGNTEAFIALMKNAFENVGEHIGTIGIRATRPETGYGYIRKGKRENGYFKVAEFCEKPARSLAERYVASGEYVWNSGMYLFSIATFLRETEEHAPKIAALMGEVWEVFLEKFATLSPISIDYAIAEKSQRMILFEGDCGWSDIGSYDSLAEVVGERFPAHHIGIDSEGIFVHSENSRPVVTIGVEDLIIVENSEGILVCKRGRSEDVKKAVEKLRESNRKGGKGEGG